MSYGFSKKTSLDFLHAVQKITDELQSRGFGVLTSINVQEILKQKLNIDGGKYIILGACNPHFAHKALQVEKNIGLLLPCNVIVYEQENSTVVAAFDPMSMTTLVDSPELVPIADEVKRRLESAIMAV